MGIMLFGLLTAKLAFKDFPRTKKITKEDLSKWLQSMADSVYKERSQYQALDSAAKSLVDGLLEFNEEKRLSARMILKHKFLRED